MANIVNSFLTKVDSSEAILIVLGDTLPSSLAFWVPLLVSNLKSQNKTVTVIVSNEGSGWSERVDSFFPVDMLLDIEPLRQNISIPLDGGSDSLGEVSYEITNGKLEVSVVPQDGVLSLDKIETSSVGIKYDLILGVGIGPHHPALVKVISSKTAILSANAIFIGTPLQESSFQKVLPFIKNVDIVSEGVDRFLLGVTRNLILDDGKVASSSSVSQMMNTLAFLYTYDRNKYIAPTMYSEVTTIMQNISAVDETIKKAAEVFSLEGREEEIVSEFIANLKEYPNNGFKYFGMSVNYLEEKGITLQDAIVASQHIPLAQYAMNSIVALEESETVHYLIVKGKAAFVRKIALKYGLAMNDHAAAGRAFEVRRDKLEADILRLATNGQEDVVFVKSSEIVSPSVSDSIPNVEENETEDILNEKTHKTEDVLEEQESFNKENRSSSIDSQPLTIPGKNNDKVGLDFGEIAKKMRESISS